jgi:Secretion system C-terminal sorting domain
MAVLKIRTAFPNGNAHTWCPASANYECDLQNWTCTGGGSSTYAQLFDNAFSEIPDGQVAAYFGNAYCTACNSTADDTSCLSQLGCEVSGIPAGYPVNTPDYGGTTGVSLSQTVSGLTIGNVYILEFWSGGEGFNVFTEDGLFAVDIGFGNTFLRDPATNPGDSGRRFIIEFYATSISHTIKFTNWGHIEGTATELTIDDVSLYTLAELSTSVPICLTSFTVEANGLNPTCQDSCNGSVNANSWNSNGPVTYVWNTVPPQTTATATNLCARTYMVIGTDSSGNIDTAYVTLTEPPPVTVYLSATSSCGGYGTATVDSSGGIGPFTYLWTPGGQTTQTADSLQPGMYTVVVTDSNGCTGTDSILVEPQGTFLVPIMQSGNLLTSVQVWSAYQWMRNSNEIGGATANTYMALQNGSYSLRATDSAGCTSVSDSIMVTILGVLDGNSDLYHLSLYPNPASDEFTVVSALPLHGDFRITITDLYGRQVKSRNLDALESETRIEIKDLAAATYIVMIADAEGHQKAFRLIVN